MIFTLSGLNGVALGKYATPETLGPADALKEAHTRELSTFNDYIHLKKP